MLRETDFPAALLALLAKNRVRYFSFRRILGTVRPSTPTTEQLLKCAEDVMRQDWEYLEDFNAAVDRLLKRQAEFQAEHPPFGDRYS